MCMMQAPINRKIPTNFREKKNKKKHIPFNKATLEPDPNFIDERKPQKIAKKKSFIEEILGI